MIGKIRTQGQGCCELDLGLLMSLEASMSPQDWEEMFLRSETLSNGFYSEPDRGLFKGRISRSGDFSSIYRMSNFQDFSLLYEISLP